MKTLVFALTVLLSASFLPLVAMAQQGKNSCPGGFSACVERCSKTGGQARLCPRYCREKKGC